MVLLAALLNAGISYLMMEITRLGIPFFEGMLIRMFVLTIFSGILCYKESLYPLGEEGQRFLPFLRGFFAHLSLGLH